MLSLPWAARKYETKSPKRQVLNTFWHRMFWKNRIFDITKIRSILNIIPKGVKKLGSPPITRWTKWAMLIYKRATKECSSGICSIVQLCGSGGTNKALKSKAGKGDYNPSPLSSKSWRNISNQCDTFEMITTKFRSDLQKSVCHIGEQRLN